MNRIERIDEQKWEVLCENGEKFTCGEWFEKKTGKWHVKLPADNPTGRTYIRVDKIPNDYLEFETKTEHRENMGWKDRMTPEEQEEWKECEERMAKIKEACMSRVVSKEERLLEKMSIEDLQRLIELKKVLGK